MTALPLAFGTDVIRGWRAWKVDDFERHGGVLEPRLLSVAEPNSWRPRARQDARCTSEAKHEAPHVACSCGIWALRTREQAVAAARNYGSGKAMAIGEIALWGRIVECEDGWRGQYAYPQRVEVLGAAHSLAAELARLYGVPVEPAPALKRPALVSFTFSVQLPPLKLPLQPFMSVARIVAFGPSEPSPIAMPGEFWNHAHKHPLAPAPGDVRKPSGFVWDGEEWTPALQG